MGPEGFWRGVGLGLVATEGNAFGAAEDHEMIVLGDGGGLASTFGFPAKFAGDGIDAGEIIVGLADEGGEAVGGFPQDGAGVAAFGFFVGPEDLAVGGVDAHEGAFEEVDFAVGIEGGAAFAVFADGGFPNEGTGVGVDGVEVGAENGVNAVVGNGASGGVGATGGVAFGLEFPEGFAGFGIKA